MYVLWNFYQLLCFLLIEDQCLTWRFHLDYFLMLTEVTYFAISFYFKSWKIGFLVIVLVGRPFNAECSGNIFLFFFIYFLLNVSWAFNFFYIPMLPLTLFFIYSHKYSFSSCKKWLLSEKFFLFLERCVHSKNNCYCQIFP